MQVTVEKTGPCQAQVRFTVPGSEFHGAVQRAVAQAGKTMNLKGFRPGHIPPQIVEKQFGKQIRNDAMQHFVQQAMDQAIKENDLKVVGFQRLNLDQITVLEGTDFSQQLEVSLRPEIALGTYKGLALESELEPVMPREVDDAIANLKLQRSQPEPAGDAGLPGDGMALAKVEWLVGEESVFSRDGIRLSPRTPPPGVEAEVFEKALSGAKDGEMRECAIVFPAEFEREDLRGKSGTCRVTVAQAYRMIPPSDEEIRTLVGAADEAELKKIVKEKIGEAKLEREQQRQEALLVDQLIEKHTFELPQMMVDEQTQARLSQLGQQMAQQQIPTDKIKEHLETQREAAAEAAKKGCRALFLMQAVAEAEKLLVTQDDMRSEVQTIAARNNAKPEEVVEYYQKNGLFDQMAIELLERKVRRFLRENAAVKEPS
ncbi:MAG: trigger factor [Planctomycetes bacterium]|nr:trigger factor [Planctomycetota bacterium]